MSRVRVHRLLCISFLKRASYDMHSFSSIRLVKGSLTVHENHMFVLILSWEIDGRI